MKKKTIISISIATLFVTNSWGAMVITSNSGFQTDSFRNTFDASPDYSTTGQWEFPTFTDRGSYQTTGGPTGTGDAYVGGSTDGTTKTLSSLLQIIDVSSLGLNGTNDITLSFNLLNNSSSDFIVSYQLFFSDTNANGAVGTATDVPTGRSPYAFKDDASLTVIQGNVTASATSGWTSSGNIATGFNTITFPGTFTYDSGGASSTTIADYADIDRLILRVGWTNVASTGGVSPIGVDNVTLNVIPEPSSALALSFGMLLIAGRRRR